MATVVTDYTQQIDTLQPGILSQYRMLKYLQGIIRNWASQPTNIQDPRLAGIFFSADNTPQDVKCTIGQPYDTQDKYAGTTPAIIVASAGSVFQARPCFPGGRHASDLLSSSQLMYTKRKIMQCTISIVTENYDATLLMAQLIASYLVRNTMFIVSDCAMIDSFDVHKIDAPNLVETKMQSKQVYGANIHITASGYLVWVVDTQGPVFRGLTVIT